MSSLPPSPPPGWNQGPDGSPPGFGVPPPPGQPGQPGYGYSYGYGYGSADHPQGTTILVLGILSLVVCQLLGPVAWTMGNTALREIDANPAAYANRGNVSAGRICGIISTVLMLVVIGLVLVVLLLGMAGAASSS